MAGGNPGHSGVPILARMEGAMANHTVDCASHDQGACDCGADEAPRPSENSHAGQHTAWGIFFEVFWANKGMMADAANTLDEGWFWWACQPGCLPDGDPQGPFATSGLAHEDAFASYADSMAELGEVAPTGHDS